jgi:hypothetical protein
VIALVAINLVHIPLLLVLALEIYFAFRLDWRDLRNSTPRSGRPKTFAARLAFSLLVPWIVAWYQTVGSITKTNRPNRQNVG